MTTQAKHISVCVCTYKRQQLLKHLLDALVTQDTGDLFTYSIVIVDNDHTRSAEAVVLDFAGISTIPITYCVEPRQNIALARNKAIENATGDFVAFIDDDECPIKTWLFSLYETLRARAVDGVLGPVKPQFDPRAPQWVIDGGFYDRPSHPTGMVLDWAQCRTGNVLLQRHVFSDDTEVFRPEFVSSEDLDFFRRKIGKGHSFIWCNEALVHEFVPPARWRRGFLIRRALLRGVFSQRNLSSSLVPIVYSFMAASAYTVLLPFALVMGQATFMAYVFSLFYHIARLLAFVGINPIKMEYVVER